MAAPPLPIVSLDAPDQVVAKDIHEACTKYGFLYVSNHGILTEVTDAMSSAIQAFFALPLDAKLCIVADSNNRGYTPFREETLDPAHQTTGDTKEGLYFGREVAPDSPEAATPLHGPNQWPDESLVPGFRAAITAYTDAVTALGMRLLRLLAVGLGLDATWFDARFSRPMLFLRPLHYDSIVSQPHDGVYGCGAHSDYGMLTILWTDGSPGLQVHLDGTWVDVPHVPGALVVNLGDMLERWTNGMYRSTRHRVVSVTGKDRYSCPFFFEPNFDAVVEALPGCCGPDNPSRYPPTTSGQHLLDKYAATHAGFEERG